MTWDQVMADDDVDEISVRIRGEKILLRWKYPDGPYHYKWFDRDQ